jgi:lipopolysaccharide export system protein LptA
MTAHYTGETGLLAEAQPVGPGEAAKAKGKGLAQGPGTAELKRIEARRSVVVTGKDGQQATGEWANFDVKANTIVMGGKVKVAQGKQMVRLPETLRLVIDLTNGVTRTEAEPGAAAAAAAAAAGPQVSGAFSTSATSQAEAKGEAAPNCPKGAVCRSGRLELILYPNQVEKSKVKVAPKAGAAAGGSAAAAAPSADGPATGGSPAGDASKSRRDKPKSRLPEESSWSTSRGVPGSQ